MRAEAEPWMRLTPVEATSLLEWLPIRWWVCGGWALELADLAPPRPHRDLDVAVLRSEHEQLRTHLTSWDLRIARRGTLTEWTGGVVGPPANAVWARASQDVPWMLDFKIELDEGGEWVYRRDKSVRRPLAGIGRVSAEGVPYLDPEIVSLYASSKVREGQRPRSGRLEGSRGRGSA